MGRPGCRYCQTGDQACVQKDDPARTEQLYPLGVFYRRRPNSLEMGRSYLRGQMDDLTSPKWGFVLWGPLTGKEPQMTKREC
jgi:hypothetical protein